MENVAGIFVMLSTFMLNVFRTGRDRSLRFSVLSNNLLPKELFRLKKKVRRATVIGEDNAIGVLAAVAYNPHWAREQIQMNPNFFRSVLFFDESPFTNHGAVNRHNMHQPHWLRQVEHQRPWSVNVWCGIIGDKLIIEGNLNGEMYQDFLNLRSY
ncbi:hypothetical protein BDFB_014623 [Asbolus verrucosus]|uniref:DDE 3 domain containing protein n=1 Tax=Asbolus verrucosus TaxID=1661398 RepID=A0A482W5D4_ASBVE|nr:hypothetical protein BDFB_014623 [Asbolus verrucosus]